MTLFLRRVTVLLAACVMAALLVACAGASQSASSADGSTNAGESGQKITVATLATEDILPFWVAQEQGLFAEAGVDVDVVVFQSATELISAVSAGEVDMAMTDIMVAASIFASGVDVQMEWVTLGQEANQGRFGIMVGPDSTVATLQDLAGVPIGVGSNTILEYVMDSLMAEAGVSESQVVVEELQKLPVRYQAMVSGEVAAAALPGSLLALGEANGCRTIADDTAGQNISQSVMIAQSSFVQDAQGQASIDALVGVWDKAADMINADPEAFRQVLVSNANLSEEVAGTYPISTYPHASLPTSNMVDPVLAWMQEKGYLTRSVSYDQTTGEFSAE